MRTALTTSATLLMVSALSACSMADGGAMESADDWDTGWWNGAPQGDDADGLDTGAHDFQVEATWWSLSGSLTITDGVVGKSDAALTLAFSGEADGNTVSVCDATPTLLAVTPSEPTDPDVEFAQWWTVELTVPNPLGCVPSSFAEESAGPLSFGLGVGPVDPLLGPALDAAGYPWDPWSGALHGLYLQTSPNDPLYVFGVTGTASQLSSTSPTPVEEGALPDGTYQLQSLYLIPL